MQRKDQARSFGARIKGVFTIGVLASLAATCIAGVAFAGTSGFARTSYDNDWLPFLATDAPQELKEEGLGIYLKGTADHRWSASKGTGGPLEGSEILELDGVRPIPFGEEISFESLLAEHMKQPEDLGLPSSEEWTCSNWVDGFEGTATLVRADGSPLEGYELQAERYAVNMASTWVEYYPDLRHGCFTVSGPSDVVMLDFDCGSRLVLDTSPATYKQYGIRHWSWPYDPIRGSADIVIEGPEGYEETVTVSPDETFELTGLMAGEYKARIERFYPEDDPARAASSKKIDSDHYLTITSPLEIQSGSAFDWQSNLHGADDGALLVSLFRALPSDASDKTVSVTVSKAWVGDEGALSERPASVKVQLYDGEVAQGGPVELTEAGGWMHAWPDLPADGDWRVVELDADERYEVSVSEPVSTDGSIAFTVTNTLKGDDAGGDPPDPQPEGPAGDDPAGDGPAGDDSAAHPLADPPPASEAAESLMLAKTGDIASAAALLLTLAAASAAAGASLLRRSRRRAEL